jgi:hypothetical protein
VNSSTWPRLCLRIRSIVATESGANLSANSGNLFFREPLPDSANQVPLVSAKSTAVSRWLLCQKWPNACARGDVLAHGAAASAKELSRVWVTLEAGSTALSAARLVTVLVVFAYIAVEFIVEALLGIQLRRSNDPDANDSVG